MTWVTPEKNKRDETLSFPSHYPKTIKFLNKMKSELASMETLYRFCLHQQLLKLCGVARRMMTQRSRWDDFVNAKWSDVRAPKRDDTARALYHLFRWVFGGSHGAIQKASFYFRALGPLLARGLSLEEIGDALTTKGLRKLADEHVGYEPKLKTKKVNAFKARKYKKLWHIPAKVSFDHDPKHLFGLSGDSYFSMTGRIKVVGEGCLIVAFKMDISEDMSAVIGKPVSP